MFWHLLRVLCTERFSKFLFVAYPIIQCVMIIWYEVTISSIINNTFRAFLTVLYYFNVRFWNNDQWKQCSNSGSSLFLSHNENYNSWYNWLSIYNGRPNLSFQFLWQWWMIMNHDFWWRTFKLKLKLFLYPMRIKLTTCGLYLI